ncbi:unnamed protein product [Callosobruchus maculatus]|uniref:Glucose-methanol-choline oxidoreductase N-terminal domain-containing protein n=1 Tax=Callosobruchus maculatus TaxID=64391 RepID=A0A653DBI9_CALMS|nr:unnamed protein product [Callosobruchus maculatus]
MQTTIRNGLRSDAENSYLRPVRDRKNLKVRTGAHVTKILIKPDSKEAYGVEYKKNDKMYKVLARREVILSAGGLNSPQVLMLSGIGPKAHLEEMGIPVVKDLPVGQTLYDHVAFIGTPYLVDQPIGLQMVKTALDPKTYLDFILHRKGIIASNGLQAVAYLKTNLTDQEYSTWPDIELLFVPFTLADDFGIFFKPLLNVNDEIYNTLCKPIAAKPSFMVLILLLHPLSKGSVRLRSKNPFDQAKYTLNYFSDPENLDVKRIIVALREVQRISRQPALKKFKAKMSAAPYPGCENIAFDSDEYWECAIRSIPSSMWHQQSTCRMGPKTDKEAVVDARLKVHGIKNLRVADTSVIPRPVSGHTVGPAYMIGEKAADMIKEDWKMTFKYNKL